MDFWKGVIDLRFLRGLMGSYGVKGLSMLVNLLCMPVYVGILGESGAGSFLTFSMTFLVLSTVDVLGLGVNIRKVVAKQWSEHKRLALRPWLRDHWMQFALRFVILAFFGGLISSSLFGLGMGRRCLFLTTVAISGLGMSLIQIEIARENVVRFALINAGHMLGFQLGILFFFSESSTVLELWGYFLVFQLLYWLIVSAWMLTLMRFSSHERVENYRVGDGLFYGLQQLLFLGSVGFVEVLFTLCYSSSTVLEYQYYFRIFSIVIVVITGLSNPLWARLEILASQTAGIGVRRLLFYLFSFWMVFSLTTGFFLICFGGFVFPVFYDLESYDAFKMVCCCLYVSGYSALVLMSVVANVQNHFKLLAVLMSGALLFRGGLYAWLSKVIEWHISLAGMGACLFLCGLIIFLKTLD